jgi:DNA-binding transcriptional ArsR family regulator
VEIAQESVSSKETIKVLAALSDENRFRIVELLSGSQQELSCGAIGMGLKLSPSLISHHLGVLQGAGLIERRKDGLWTLNSLRRDELQKSLSDLERLCRPAVAS